MCFIVCLADAKGFYVPMKKCPLSLVVVCSLISGCSAVTGSEDVVHGRYSDYSAASEMRALQNGWLPARIPVSATNIEEAHNIDSGEIWIRFSYDERGFKEFIGHCIEGASMNFPESRRSARAAEWWPRELTDGADTASRSRWTLFECREMDHAGSLLAAGVAVDRSTRVAFYWVAKK